MKIEFKVTTPKKGAFEKRAQEVLRKQVVKWLEDRLSEIKCPQHQEHPTVSVRGSLKNPEFRIEGCCEGLIEKATEALK